MQEPIDYLNPALPAGLTRVPMPVVEATVSSLQGYGHLVDDPGDCRIEIVRRRSWRARIMRTHHNAWCCGLRTITLIAGSCSSRWSSDALSRRRSTRPS